MKLDFIYGDIHSQSHVWNCNIQSEDIVYATQNIQQ